MVILKSLEHRVLSTLRKAYPGQTRMEMLASSFVYLPTMDSDIEKLVRTCPRYASVAKDPQKAELQSWPKPYSPWTRVHADFAEPMKGRYHLLIVDVYSKWLEIVQISAISSTATIKAKKCIFAKFGDTRDPRHGQRYAVQVVSIHFILPFPRNLAHSHAVVLSTKQQTSRNLCGHLQKRTRQAEGGTNSGRITDIFDGISLHSLSVCT
ncbi:hypothetical protein RB195_023413 [Necator americanus]